MLRYRLAILGLASSLIGATAANADVLYTNPDYPGTLVFPGTGYASSSPTGAGQSDGWNISGFIIGSSFTLAAASTVTGVDFGAWNTPGDVISEVTWSILSVPDGSGTTYASGSAPVTSTPAAQNGSPNLAGFDINVDSFSIPSLDLASGTYWLDLQDAVVANGDTAYWDQGGGASEGWGNDGAGYLTAANTCNNTVTTTNPDGSQSCGMSFDITGTTAAAAVPEPASLALFSAALLGLGALRRRRRA